MIIVLVSLSCMSSVTTLSHCPLPAVEMQLESKAQQPCAGRKLTGSWISVNNFFPQGRRISDAVHIDSGFINATS